MAAGCFRADNSLKISPVSSLTSPASFISGDDPTAALRLVFPPAAPSPPFIHIPMPLTIITGKGERRRDGREIICRRESLWNRKLHRAAPILQSQGEATLMLRNWSFKRGKKQPLGCAAPQLTLSMVQNGFRAKDFISRCRSVCLQFAFCW